MKKVLSWLVLLCLSCTCLAPLDSCMYDILGNTTCVHAGVLVCWCCVVQDCYVVIQKTTQIMMDRLRQILAVDAVSCSQVIIGGARVYKYAGGAANYPNWYNVVGHVRRMIDRITGNFCMQFCTMLSICSNFATAHKLEFNTSKTQLICFRKTRHCSFPVLIHLNGHLLHPSDKVIHILTCNLRDTDDILRSCKDLNRKANYILLTFKAVDPFVKSFLINEWLLPLDTLLT